jgi:hypothetical protein
VTGPIGAERAATLAPEVVDVAELAGGAIAARAVNGAAVPPVVHGEPPFVRADSSRSPRSDRQFGRKRDKVLQRCYRHLSSGVIVIAGLASTEMAPQRSVRYTVAPNCCSVVKVVCAGCPKRLWRPTLISA